MAKKKISDKERKRRAAQQKAVQRTVPQSFQPKKKAWKR
jgi:hypothetical protein